MSWRANRRLCLFTAFKPASGAAGFQVSNVSVLDLTAVLGSMSVFERTSMSAVRHKSIRLTGYLEHLLRTNFLRGCSDESGAGSSTPFEIVTPASPAERGAQLSLRIRPDLLDTISTELDRAYIIVDVRKPDIMRVTPMPLYNTYADAWYFVSVFTRALKC
jgi:kynureninase